MIMITKGANRVVRQGGPADLASAHSPLRVVNAAHSPGENGTRPAQPSQIKVDVKPGGPIVLTTSSAEFRFYLRCIQASLQRPEAHARRATVAGPSCADGKPLGLLDSASQGSGK